MAKDHAKKPNRRAPAKRNTPKRSPAKTDQTRSHSRRLWFFLGFSSGICVVLLGQVWRAPETDIAAAVKEITAAPRTESGPRFDFYTLLKDEEVQIPAADLPPTTTTNKASSEQQGEALYFLQAGSFRNAADADSVRVRLILLNLEAKVEQSNSGGDTWHRVMAGPFQSQSKLLNARSALLNEGIDNMIVKRKTAQ